MPFPDSLNPLFAGKPQPGGAPAPPGGGIDPRMLALLQALASGGAGPMATGMAQNPSANPDLRMQILMALIQKLKGGGINPPFNPQGGVNPNLGGGVPLRGQGTVGSSSGLLQRLLAGS